jgi:heme exporter protein C
MWGTYWEWDARLPRCWCLFLMYLGLIALWRAVEDPSRAARAAAILTLVGAINLPIIKFSVDWWNTLHQPASVLRMAAVARPRVPDSAAGDGGGVFAAVRHAASGGDAQRDPAPPRPQLQMMQASQQGGVDAMSLGPYASFIVTSYTLVAASC